MIQRVLGPFRPFSTSRGFTFAILLCCWVWLWTSLPVVAQEKPVEEKVYVTAEQMPEFPGGQGAMLKYLANNFVINMGIDQDSLNGTMVASFVISKEGKVTQVEIVKKLLPSLDQELVRVVSSMPNWKPGMVKGEPVAVRSSVPFKVVWKGLTPKGAIASVTAKNESPLPKKEKNLWMDQPLEFPGGEKAFWQYMRENKAFLDDARKTKAEGVIAVQFTISETGKVNNVGIIKSLHPVFDQAVVRALKNMPLWKVKNTSQKPEPLSLGFSLGVKQGLSGLPDEEQERLHLTLEVFHIAQDDPTFLGGREALLEFLAANLAFPESAKQDKVEGLFSVEGVINRKGEIGYLDVTHALHPSVDTAIMQVIKKMPTWKPGRINGRFVNVRTEFSFRVANNTITLLENPPVWKPRYYQGYWQGIPDPVEMQARLKAKAEQKQLIVDALPEFPGGEQGMWQFMKEHKASLEDAKQRKVAGTLEAEFQISETGKVSDIRITKSLDAYFDHIVMNALEKMPEWKPAIQGGKAVPVIHSFSYEVTEGEKRVVEKEFKEEKVYLHAERMPVFPGGQGSLQKYIAKNLLYPPDARQENAAGTLVLSFIVDSKGQIHSLEVVQRVHPGVDDAVLNLFKQMPAWRPASLDDRKVAIRVRVPLMIANNSVVPVGNW
ncbi:TonB family protein [Rufibacter hautae]|uniref:TonB family protein n=1 Tax=Rufibacter hautae TaxID=2595005 RepID=A0A5B6TA23_9BACT|nr:TonB family protein [Rufibacter hautae]KAA3436410.1 TonB family protein [Rufibacter hautae]